MSSYQVVLTLDTAILILLGAALFCAVMSLRTIRKLGRLNAERNTAVMAIIIPLTGNVAKLQARVSRLEKNPGEGWEHE